MSETNNNLPILRQENVQLIVQSAPDAYNTNSQSSMRCSGYGKNLLAEIQQHGMTDEMDKRCADYIDKAKRTLKAMNERRAPFTKLFDQIRSEFTGMENFIDPAKKDTVPYLIQQKRNAYAAKKREEAERARQEEMLRKQREDAINRYRQDVEDDYRRQFDQKVTTDINILSVLNHTLSIENFDEVSKQIREFSHVLPNEWFQKLPSYVHHPIGLTEEETKTIQHETLNRIASQLKNQYQTEVGEYRDTITDSLHSKKAELERMAKANAEEQARMKAELEAREAAETRRLDEERKRREEEAQAAKKAQQTATEMDGLFDQAAVAAPVGYQPKTAVRKRVVTDSPDGILAVVSQWWSKEGRFLSMEELSKIFKKQITFCEKLANDKANPEFISSPFVRYEEEVKAK